MTDQRDTLFNLRIGRLNIERTALYGESSPVKRWCETVQLLAETYNRDIFARNFCDLLKYTIVL